MKKETKVKIFFSILFLILGVNIGIVTGIGIYAHKSETPASTTQQTTSETPASTTQQTTSETPATNTSETVKATPPDNVHNVLLKVNGKGLIYLENEGYIKLTNNRYGMAPGKSYIEDNALELKTANAYGRVSTQYIWVSEYNKNELLNSGYFEAVNYD